ncbi:anti-sigma factor [Microbacterium sp. SA39]|uniref:anti-sigma factor n=1 Tax=Microbacterium sp. SA39 TaxID=1263625 RepID=UPI0005FA5963|nr:anti-sigma factor [Microbacterium sp. SA39]KJQ55341.1 Anti-sigma-K factor rskA [Microbacterium sp. SA39]
MNEQEFAELAAGAALNALSPDDRRRFDDALLAHPEWHAIAEADAETAATLAESAAPQSPPTALRAALLAQITETPQLAETPGIAETMKSAATPDDPARVPAPKRRWSRAVFALAACLAVLVGVGVGAVALNQQLNRPASVVALEQIQSAEDAEQATVELPDGGSATAHWSASAGAAVLVTDGIPAPADGKTYELWFVRGEDAIPAGVFDVDDGRATAALEGDMRAGDVIAVTVEQAGGSPDGTPTTDPVIVIPTA